MDGIQNEILSRYGIDIARENIFKLYKIESYEISTYELENKIKEVREEWNISLKGTNREEAQKAKVYLDNADKYEEILKDEFNRKEIYKFYNKMEEVDQLQMEENVKFAVDFFKLVATTFSNIMKPREKVKNL